MLMGLFVPRPRANIVSVMICITVVCADGCMHVYNYEFNPKSFASMLDDLQ